MPQKIVILSQGHTNPKDAKTAASVIRYRTDEVIAIYDTTQAGQTSEALLEVGGNIPVIGALSEIPEADTLLIGIAPQGGKLPADWKTVILEALGRGMTIVSGLHDFLCNDPELVSAAQQGGAELIDLRKNNERDVATQREVNDSCLRIHTVGHDCSIGKMVTTIEICRALERAGHDAKFIATGQTGMMIEGDGCPIDCVVGDFISGAAERLVLANQHRDILMIEGQGSLFHPSYAAVTLGLLHGSMPDGLILCYEVGRTAIHRLEHVKLPSLSKIRETYETMASAMHPCRVIGVAMNSRTVSASEAEVERIRVRDELGLPVCDVLRHGPDDLVKAVLDLKQELGK